MPGSHEHTLDDLPCSDWALSVLFTLKRARVVLAPGSGFDSLGAREPCNLTHHSAMEEHPAYDDLFYSNRGTMRSEMVTL